MEFIKSVGWILCVILVMGVARSLAQMFLY